MTALSETSPAAVFSTVCPLCGAEDAPPRFTTYGFTLLECARCSFRFIGERWSEEQLRGYYARGYFQGRDVQFGYRDYQGVEANKAVTFEKRLNTLKALLPGRGRLLDVGCATGLCVETACRSGWDAFGIDISDYAVEVANDRTDGRCFCAGPHTAPFDEGAFDAVTLFDCIEHVYTPVPFLEACIRLLRPGGLVLVETPNVGGAMAVVMGQRWPYYRPPEHLVYFRPQTLERAFSLVGCEMLSLRPSLKCVDFAYISSELSVSNPLLSRLVAFLSRSFPGRGKAGISLPTGSFWAVARKRG